MGLIDKYRVIANSLSKEYGVAYFETDQTGGKIIKWYDPAEFERCINGEIKDYGTCLTGTIDEKDGPTNQEVFRKNSIAAIQLLKKGIV